MTEDNTKTDTSEDENTSDGEVSMGSDHSDTSTSRTTEETAPYDDPTAKLESKRNVDRTEIIGNSPPSAIQATTRKQGIKAASRLCVIEALAYVTTQTGSIPPEAESMVEDVLRSWDGKEDWGVLLCYDILPYVHRTNTFSELRANILVHLEKLFLFGTCKLQHAIISGAVTSLLSNIATRKSKTGDQWHAEMLLRRKMIKELIHWADDLLLQGFLAQKDGELELLSSAVLDFFRVVCQDVSHSLNLIVLPSTNVVYRLLLSTSAVAIDRVCQLLVEYKGCFQQLKQMQQGLASSSEGLQIEGLDR